MLEKTTLRMYVAQTSLASLYLLKRGHRQGVGPKQLSLSPSHPGGCSLLARSSRGCRGCSRTAGCGSYAPSLPPFCRCRCHSYHYCCGLVCEQQFVLVSHEGRGAVSMPCYPNIKREQRVDVDIYAPDIGDRMGHSAVGVAIKGSSLRAVWPRERFDVTGPP